MHPTAPQANPHQIPGLEVQAGIHAVGEGAALTACLHPHLRQHIGT